MTSTVRFAPLACFTLIGLLAASTAHANHPVLVEGERDFDGDGLVGTAEDTDNDTDQIFGTISAALGSANRGVNQNGTVTIVTSGRFVETVTITASGNVTLEAAPGVHANIEAVRAGDPNNGVRQTLPGIVVSAPGNRVVILRNLTIHNWTVGIQVLGSSRVTIEGCRLENNRDYGIQVTGGARVDVNRTTVTASGFRSGASPVDNTPDPGIGIAFEDSSSGSVTDSAVTASFGAGIANESSRNAVRTLEVAVSGNNPNFVGILPSKTERPTVGTAGSE